MLLNQYIPDASMNDSWLATVKKQLRNPPWDHPLWPFGMLMVILVFYVLSAYFIKDTFTRYWPEWHTNLIISVAVLNLPLMTFWSLTILVTWLYDKLKHQPTITSANPTYHRLYYVIKYAFIGLLWVEISFCVLLAVFSWWDQSLFAVLIAAIAMSAVAVLRMRGWHPSKIWGQSGRTGSSSLAWGVASLVIIIFKIISALMGQGASISFMQVLMGFIFAGLAYSAPMAAIAWSLFSLIHLGIIKK